MKVFQIKADVDEYQTLILDDDSLWSTEHLMFDSTKKQEGWIRPKVDIYTPKLKKGNFPYLCAGLLVCDEVALEALLDLFERSGEILELDFDGRALYAINVLDCVNALDQEKSVWSISKRTGKRLTLKQYSFHKDRIPETPLFKIPETCRGHILTFSGMKDPEDEFISRYQQADLQGLLFEEVWCDLL